MTTLFLLAAALVLVPVETFEVSLGGIEVSAADGLLLLTFLFYVFRTMLLRRIWAVPHWLVVVWFAYLLSSVTSVYQGNLRMVITLAGSAVLFFLILSVVRDMKALRLMLKVWIFSALIHSALGILIFWNYYNSGDTRGLMIVRLFDNVVPRVTSTFDDPNYYGIYLLPALAVLLALIVYEARHGRRFILAPLAALVAGGIVVSFSRTAIAGMVVAALVVILFRWGGSLRGLLLTSFAIVLIAVAVLLPLLNLPIISGLIAWNVPAVVFRYFTMEQALSLWASSPIWGLGLGPPSYFVHNTYLLVAVRAGLLGLIPFALLIFAAFRSSLRGTSLLGSEAKWVAGAMGGFYCMSLALMFFGIEGHKMLWFSVALATAAGRILLEGRRHMLATHGSEIKAVSRLRGQAQS